MSAARRRLVYQGGTSDKFWEIEVRGTSHVVRYGRTGTQGQKRTKHFDSVEQAQASADKLIRSKKKKGYREPAAKSATPVVLAWRRIREWFDTNLPTVDMALRTPASERLIRQSEEALGAQLPSGFREFLAIHDGQEDEPTVHWLPYAVRLGSLASIVECWNQNMAFVSAEGVEPERFDVLDSAERVRQVHYHPKHIPIAGSAYWDYDQLLIDLAPGANGTAGQIIARFGVNFIYVCRSFEDFLTRYADGLESGRIISGGFAYDNVVEMVFVSPRAKKPIAPPKFFQE